MYNIDIYLSMRKKERKKEKWIEVEGWFQPPSTSNGSGYCRTTVKFEQIWRETRAG